MGTTGEQSPNPQVRNKFKFWFNSSESATETEDAKEHMKDVEVSVKKLAKRSKGQMSFYFLNRSSFEIQI